MKKLLPLFFILLAGCTQMKNRQIINNTQWIANFEKFSGSCVRYEGSQVFYFDPAILIGAPEKPDADIIFVSHPHKDHCDIESITSLLKEDGIIVTNQEVFDLISEEIGPEKFKIISPWEETDIKGLQIQALPSYEKGSTIHPKSSGWTGFVVNDNENKIYFSGDSGEMEEIKDFPEIDLAILCVRDEWPTLMFNQMSSFCQVVNPMMMMPVHWPVDYGEYYTYVIQEKCLDLPEETELIMMEKTADI